MNRDQSSSPIPRTRNMASMAMMLRSRPREERSRVRGAEVMKPVLHKLEPVLHESSAPAGAALITPALFSQPPPRPPGEEGERHPISSRFASSFPFSPGGKGGRLGEKGVGG